MEVSIYLKDATGKPFLMQVCDFNDQEFTALREDWLNYGTRKIPKTGAYKCRDVDGNAKEILLNFDEVAAIS